MECMQTQLLSLIRFFVVSWTVTHQASLSMEFSRQEYWNVLLFATPGDLYDPGIKPTSPALSGMFFYHSHLGRPKKTSKSYPPIPGKVTLTGNRVLADVIKLRILKGDHPELRMDSKSNDSCAYKWKEREVEDGARDGVMLPHAKEHWQPGEVGETRKGLLS